ncbi:MAG: hypothetical protein DI566_09390 [Microbacterium sp.]|nr:MAG: hypothetical protein DI566_09390 [Microbacterium sp.]
MSIANVISAPVELFVGQFVALLPTRHPDEVGEVERYQMRVLFPRLLGGVVRAANKPLRPRVYSLTTGGDADAVLTAGGTEIPVVVLPLDVFAPAEATAFQVVAMSGRTLSVRGVPEGDISA